MILARITAAGQALLRKLDRPVDQFLEKLLGHLGQKTGRGFYTYPNPSFERPGWVLGQDQE